MLFLLMGCSLVVGELPEPVPADAGVGQNAGSGSGGTSSGGHAGASAGGSSSVPDADVPSGGSDAAASGGAPSSGGSDAGFDECDRDGDGEQSEDCGGNDCDDDDRRAHPNQEEYFDEESETVGFDYNCNNYFDREYPALTCSLEACDTEQGFLAPLQPCGEEGEWGQCVPSEPVGLMCTELVNGMRRVACH